MEISFGILWGARRGIHTSRVQASENTHVSVKPTSARLKKMLEQHYVVVNPKGRESVPQKAKRNLKRKATEAEGSCASDSAK